MTDEERGHAIIGAAIKVHSALGPGLLESAYETCLIYELEKQRLSVRRQVMIPIRYEDLTIDNGYRIDLLVGDQVVVELKAVEAILPVHRGQLLSYLRLGGFRLGYLLNFSCCAHARRHRENARWLLSLRDLCASFVTFVVKCSFCGEVLSLGDGECVSRR
jgi:GxxExxY protein